MSSGKLNVVTGAFGFTGKHIAKRLLAMGHRVRTLTAHPSRIDPFGGVVEVFPLSFDNPKRLEENLRGVTTLYNTYWIRFARGAATFQKAVENSRVLIEAAKRAGVHRIVHISITNPSEESALPYFHGKARVERAIHESGLLSAILRPTVIFGSGGILINNIAYLLRRFPVFGIPGKGDYRLQPVFVDDLADEAVRAGRCKESLVIDVVNPEVFSFREMVCAVARAIGSKTKIVCLPAPAALLIARVVGIVLGDVMLTRDEVAGLSANLLISDQPPLAPTRLSDWLDRSSDQLGRRYVSELAMHYR